MKFQVGNHVLVTDVHRGIEQEPARIEQVDARNGDYWCAFERGRKKSQASYVGLSLEEVRLNPHWCEEEQLQLVEAKHAISS